MKTGVCKHFRGIQHDTCRAGLNARDITGGEAFGWTKRMPCFATNNATALCEKYEEPTTEELAKQEAEWERVFARMAKVRPIISELKSIYKDQSWAGTRECPICSGTLHLAISASNGHVHGRCETDGCLAWME